MLRSSSILSRVYMFVTLWPNKPSRAAPLEGEAELVSIHSWRNPAWRTGTQASLSWSDLPSADTYPSPEVQTELGETAGRGNDSGPSVTKSASIFGFDQVRKLLDGYSLQYSCLQIPWANWQALSHKEVRHDWITTHTHTREEVNDPSFRKFKTTIIMKFLANIPERVPEMLRHLH